MRLRRLTLVLAMACLTCPLALAETVPSNGRRIVQEMWTFQQGAPEYIQAIVQTTDGFLWLGGPNGLVRFDGMRFEPFHAVAGDQLLSTNVYSLYAPSSGGL
jgi:ligand-binding sensor domain-containing protein